MSRVTINDVVRDYDASACIRDGGCIEIIPRALVERAMKEFIIQEERASKYDGICYEMRYQNIGKAEAFQYAYSFLFQLLKQFEGEEVQ